MRKPSAELAVLAAALNEFVRPEENNTKVRRLSSGRRVSASLLRKLLLLQEGGAMRGVAERFGSTLARCR